MNPETLLYIYYLEGKVPSGKATMPESFIGNWEEEGSSFLFFTEPEEQSVIRLTREHTCLQLMETYQMRYGDWQGGRVEPLQIGPYLFTPPWLRDQIEENDKDSTILMDPGLVFGNGAHPTTRDCVEALELVMARESLGIDKMLDLGTGTGVLAMAAAKMGVGQVLALDFNFLAAKTAWENVCLNGMEERVLVLNGRAEDFIDQDADLLVANIHYHVMKELVRSEGFLRFDWFVLSGLLRSEAKAISDFLATRPAEIIRRWDQGGIWYTLCGKSCTR